MIKIANNDIKNIYFQEQEIKAVYLQDSKIFPVNTKSITNQYYYGFWNTGTASHTVQSVESILQDNGDIKFIVGSNSWYFLCKNNSWPTIDNPCVGYNDNGTETNKYDAFWCETRDCWIIRDNTKDDTDGMKFKYIARDKSTSQYQYVACNRDNLIL